MNSNNQRPHEWLVKGMHCAGCASRLENLLKKLPLVGQVSVNFATARASVSWGDGAPVETRLERFLSVEKAIRDAGFLPESPPLDPAQEQASQDHERSAALRLWLGAAAGFLPLAAMTMTSHFSSKSWAAAPFPGRFLLELLLSAAVVFLAGRGILSAGWSSARKGEPDMNVLIGSGAVLAWMGSVVAHFAGVSEHEGGGYFEAAAGIIAFALFGRWLELRNRAKAGQAILALAQLQPGVARVQSAEGLSEIALEALEPGMCVRVAPGERIPIDGEVLEGRSTVDESWVSGESVPVVRGPGSQVIGGTLNGDGALLVRVESSGRDTFLQQVLKIVRQAQTGKPKVQRLADRVSVHFAFWVLIASLLTAGGWLVMGAQGQRISLAFWHGLAVLVVACPCALGLATAVAVLAGTGRGAQLGILFRNGEALESLSKVKVVAFDKTGTLTRGRLEVVEWWERKVYEGQLIAWVAAAEKQSAHPAAHAVVQSAKALGKTVGEATEVESIPGSGLIARVDEGVLMVGGADWMQAQGVALPPATPQERAERIWIALGGEFAGWFRVADQIREEAVEVIAELKKRGVESVLISGDNALITERIASQAGITRVFAGVRPEAKREIIIELQKLGITAMVGDGVNDTPALAQADIGIAMGGGTAAARQTADVTLIRDDLRSLLKAVDLSRKTLWVIRENLGLAFGYNALAIPAAAGLFEALHGWAPGPVAASAAMALSSVSVVLNALRLRAFGRGR